MANLSNSKLGSHVDRNETPNINDRFWRSGCRVAFVSGDNALTAQLSRNDGVMIGARHWDFPGEDDWDRMSAPYGSDMLRMATEWVQITYANIERIAINGGNLTRICWQAANEPASVFSPDTMKRYAEFEAERCRLMYEHGWKAQIGNFAVGNPHIGTYIRTVVKNERGRITASPLQNIDDRYDPWIDFHPALQAAHEGNHVLGLHEYFWLYPALWYAGNQDDQELGQHTPKSGYLVRDYADGWLLCRYRKVWRNHIEENGRGNIRILISETGSDYAGTSDYTKAFIRNYGYPDYIRGWKNMIPFWRDLFPEFSGLSDDQLYLEFLQWYDEQMQADPYILGACVFCEGVWDKNSWRDFDIAGSMAEVLYNYIEDKKRT